MAHSVDVRTIERLGETRWGRGVVCFRVTALGSSPVLRCFRNAGPRIPCNLVTVEHQRPEKRPAGRGGRRPRKNDPRRQRALICTAWCVEELRVRVGVAWQALSSKTRRSFVFCRPGRGAPRESWPSAGLLGWIARDSVRGLAHGGGPLARGGTLLDWSWERPVRLWRWESGCCCGRREGRQREPFGVLCSQVSVACGRGLLERADPQPGVGNLGSRCPDAAAEATSPSGYGSDEGGCAGSGP